MTNNELYKEIHISLSGKGGAGKTTNFVFLAQYFRDYKCIPEENLIFIDTDQVNASFYGFEDLHVKALDVTDAKTNDINTRLWDSLPNMVATAPDKSVFIIDTGASVYQSLKSYLDETNLIPFLAKHFKCFIHFSFANGAEIDNTLGDFKNLIMTLEGLKQTDEQIAQDLFTVPEKHQLEKPENVNYVLWLNTKDGHVEYCGDEIINVPVVKNLGKIINLPKKIPRLRLFQYKDYDTQMFLTDIRELLKKRLTFRQALESVESSVNPFGESPHGLPVMTRQRLKIVWNDLCEEFERRGF